jgi:hypothetical protein
MNRVIRSHSKKEILLFTQGWKVLFQRVFMDHEEAMLREQLINAQKTIIPRVLRLVKAFTTDPDNFYSLYFENLVQENENLIHLLNESKLKLMNRLKQLEKLSKEHKLHKLDKVDKEWEQRIEERREKKDIQMDIAKQLGKGLSIFIQKDIQIFTKRYRKIDTSKLNEEVRLSDHRLAKIEDLKKTIENRKLIIRMIAIDIDFYQGKVNSLEKPVDFVRSILDYFKMTDFTPEEKIAALQEIQDNFDIC